MTRYGSEYSSVRCGNCRKTYEVPDDPALRYAAVQAHKLVCPERDKVAEQHLELVKDFEEQQRRAKRPARPWWKFWRRGA